MLPPKLLSHCFAAEMCLGLGIASKFIIFRSTAWEWEQVHGNEMGMGIVKELEMGINGN